MYKDDLKHFNLKKKFLINFFFEFLNFFLE